VCALLMLQVVGFDMVDDESKPERRPTKHSPLPQVRHFSSHTAPSPPSVTTFSGSWPASTL